MNIITVGHYNRSANSENESQEIDATGNPILIFLDMLRT